MNNLLYFDCWYDDYDPEHLVYFTIRYGLRTIWQSQWYDTKEFAEDQESLKSFRNEVKEACLKFSPNNVNTSELWSDDSSYFDWIDY